MSSGIGSTCNSVSHQYMRRRPMCSSRRMEMMMLAAENAPSTNKTCVHNRRSRVQHMKGLRMVPCYTPEGVGSFMQPVQERLVFT